MLRVGDKGDFVTLPCNKNDALDFDIHTGQVKVVISPKSVCASEKIVYLKIIKDETTRCDIYQFITDPDFISLS